MRNWLGLSNLPQPPKIKPPASTGGLVKSGHAEVVADKNSGGVKWLTFGANDDIGIPMVINEPLSFPPSMFKIGAKIIILEEPK
jgi:hypothetical protein